jgi:hypothetical protein
MSEPIPTTERLARAIEERRDQFNAVQFPELHDLYTRFAADARTGKYDDFKSPFPNPIGELVQRFHRLGEDELARRAMAGDFDATAAEAEAWHNTPEGQAAELEWGRAARDIMRLFGGSLGRTTPSADIESAAEVDDGFPLSGRAPGTPDVH